MRAPVEFHAASFYLKDGTHAQKYSLFAGFHSVMDMSNHETVLPVLVLSRRPKDARY